MADEKPNPEFDSDAEVPGLKEARRSFDRTYWRFTKRMSLETLMMNAKWYIKSSHATLFRKLEKASLVVKNPAALLTGISGIENIRVRLALEELSAVPEGAALADLVKAGMQVRLDNKLPTMGISHPGNIVGEGGDERTLPGTVIVQGISNRGMVVALLAHEIHHQRQIMAHLLEPYQEGKMPSPVEVLWYNRFVEADAHATAIDICWKLKQAGKPSAWNFVRYVDRLGPMAERYEQMAAKDPASVTDGRAKRAAFDRWFEPTPMKHSAGATVSQTYNSIGAKLAPDLEKAEEWVAKGIRVEPMTTADLAKLGDLAPFNYLKIPGGRTLDDLFYRRVDWGLAEATLLGQRHAEYDQLRGKFNRAAARQQPLPQEFAPPQPFTVLKDKVTPAEKNPPAVKDLKIWS